MNVFTPQFLGTEEAHLEFERTAALQPLVFIVEYSTTQLYLAVGVARAVVLGVGTASTQQLLLEACSLSRTVWLWLLLALRPSSL